MYEFRVLIFSQARLPPPCLGSCLESVDNGIHKTLLDETLPAWHSSVCRCVYALSHECVHVPPPLIPPPPHPGEVDRMSSLLLQGRQTLRAHVHVKNQSAIENRRVCTTLATIVNEASYLHMCTHTKNVVNIQIQYNPRRYYRVRVLLRNLSQKRRLHCGFFPSKGNWKRWWMSNLLAMMLILQLTDIFTVDILTSLSVHVKFQY